MQPCSGRLGHHQCLVWSLKSLWILWGTLWRLLSTSMLLRRVLIRVARGHLSSKSLTLRVSPGVLKSVPKADGFVAYLSELSPGFTEGTCKSRAPHFHRATSFACALHSLKVYSQIVSFLKTKGMMVSFSITLVRMALQRGCLYLRLVVPGSWDLFSSSGNKNDMNTTAPARTLNNGNQQLQKENFINIQA